MSIARRASPLQVSNFSWHVGVAVSCLVLGLALGSAPVIAWGLIGAFLGSYFSRLQRIPGSVQPY